MAEYRELWESEEFRKLVEEFGSDEAITEFNAFFDGDVSMNDAIHMALINKKLKVFAGDFNKYAENQKAAGEPITLEVIPMTEEEVKGLKVQMNNNKKGKVIDLRDIGADEFEKWIKEHPDAFKYNIQQIKIHKTK